MFLVKIPLVESRPVIVDLPGCRRKDRDCSDRSQRRTAGCLSGRAFMDSRRSSWRRPRPWSTRPASVERIIMSCGTVPSEDVDVVAVVGIS